MKKRHHFWSQIWRGKTPVRAWMNLALDQTGTWSGNILDIGGTTDASYREFFQTDPAVKVTTVNIDEASKPDILADAARLPLPDASFDHAWCLNVLEHIADPAAVMQEAARVLRPGARLVVFTPFLVRVHGHPDDYQRFTDSGLKRLADRSGFVVDSVTPMGGGPFIAAASQVQAVLPRPVGFVVIWFGAQLDRLLGRLRPALIRPWVLGYLMLARKSS